MKEVIHGIYVPGLGDQRRPLERAFGTKWLKHHGVNLTSHRMRWQDRQPLEPKLIGLTQAIDDAYQQYGKVVLLGSSAGFGAVLNAYAHDPSKVAAVVGLCGKVHNPQTVASRFAKNPAFEESLVMLPASLDTLQAGDHLTNVLSLRPLKDHIVDPQDTIIVGAQEGILPSNGHALSIVRGLTVDSAQIAKFMHDRVAQSS